LYAGEADRAARILGPMTHWAYVGGAYVLVFAVLLAYGWRVERGIRALEGRTEPPPAGGREARAPR
jgi:hypothetical protein